MILTFSLDHEEQGERHESPLAGSCSCRHCAYCLEHSMSLWLCGHRFCKNKHVTWKIAFVVCCSGNHHVESDLDQVQTMRLTGSISLESAHP